MSPESIRHGRPDRNEDNSMNCKEIRERMSEYIDGVLDEERKQVLMEHVGACANCRRELSELERTIALVRSLEEVDPPADLLKQVHARLAVKEKSQPVIFYLFSLPQTRIAIAAALLLVVGIYGYLEVMPSSRPVPEKLTKLETKSVTLDAVKPAQERESAIEAAKMPEALPSKLQRARGTTEEDRAGQAKQAMKKKAEYNAVMPGAPASKEAEAPLQERLFSARREETAGGAVDSTLSADASLRKQLRATTPAGKLTKAEEKKADAVEENKKVQAEAMHAEAGKIQVDRQLATGSGIGFGAAGRSAADGVSPSLELAIMTIATADKASVAKVLEEFIEAEKDTDKDKTIGGAHETQDSKADFILRISPERYPDLVAKLRNLGKLTVKPVNAKPVEKAEAGGMEEVKAVPETGVFRFITIQIRIIPPGHVTGP